MDSFTKKREQQEIATRHCIERANLTNSMDRMRANTKLNPNPNPITPTLTPSLILTPNFNP